MKKTAVLIVSIILLGLSHSISANAADSTGADNPKYETATFAGGCFWCLQPPFDKTEGVVTTIVGYTGGPEKNPTYQQVASGTTGHAESIEIIYDPEKVTYEELLDIYWKNIDPTDSGGQFVDRGRQYRPAIFYHGEAQSKAAQASKEKLDMSGKFKKPIVVEIVEAAEFYPAEDYHQSFYKKEKLHYKVYRYGSGRDGFIDKYWDESESD